MLYVTTRNKVDSFTPHHVLNHDRSRDDGFFVPLQLPFFTVQQLGCLAEKTFGQCMADVLNPFFTSRLDGWDVDFCIGRQPVRMVPLNQKVYVAEAWHNPDRDFSRMVRNLASRIRGDKENIPPTEWAKMATRIAVIFASYAQMCRQGFIQPGELLDISLAAGDFSAPMAAWFARKMGLPIGNIICAAEDDSRFWDFLRNGVFQTSGSAGSANMRSGLERLIYFTFDHEEVKRYVTCCRQGVSYSLNEFRLHKLTDGFRAAVVSSRRIAAAIRGTYGAAAYLLDPVSALAFSGLQDCRTAEGETRPTLMISESSPVHSAQFVGAAAGIPIEELQSRL